MKKVSQKALLFDCQFEKILSRLFLEQFLFASFGSLIILSLSKSLKSFLKNNEKKICQGSNFWKPHESNILKTSNT